ncbi:MAG: hypothetical protein LBK71_07550 [Verrucomicrobiales bacterium]|jgi:hypothetical protein|nr:hypothetical protein [Verrucomicrobiales bacterium]
MNRLKKLQRFLPIGALGISLILHLAIFLGISGIILIQAVAPKIVPAGDYSDAAAVNDIPPPPDVPDEQPDTPNPVTPQEDAALTAAPVPSFSIEQISSANASAAPAFAIAPPSALPVSSSGTPPPQADSAASRADKRANNATRAMSNPFAVAATTDEGALGATFYDLKQTADGKPSEMWGHPELAMGPEMATKEGPVANQLYGEVVRKFVDGGWKDSVLEKYFHVDKNRRGQPMGTFRIFLPHQGAEGAPEAFNLDRKKVLPKRWVIVYRGSFVAPDTGWFRFVGFCDDVMVVRLGNKNVMEGSLRWGNCFITKDNKISEPIGLAVANGFRLFAGSWFKLESGQPYPLSILIGECPGGDFSAFLLIQKRDEKYADGGVLRQERETPDPANPKKTKKVVLEHKYGPVLPIFELAPLKRPGVADKYTPGQSGPKVTDKAFICQ